MSESALVEIVSKTLVLDPFLQSFRDIFAEAKIKAVTLNPDLTQNQAATILWRALEAEADFLRVKK